MAVSLSWIVLSVLGALPYFMSGYFLSPVDALFESFSGFTTTGATLLTDVEAAPKSILFWRSFTQWLGGMGVLVLMLALLPKLGAGSTFLLQAESPGAIKTKLVPRVGETAKILYAIYIILTVAEILCLRIAGMPWYDSTVNAMSTVATGGFSCRSASIGAYNSTAICLIVSLFMILSALNFSALYCALVKRSFNLLKHGETRIYCIVLLSSTALITADLVLRGGYDLTGGASTALFQVASASSTTGFTSADYSLWPAFSQRILLLLMLVGGCAGSTSGGLKMQRMILLVRLLKAHLQRMIHPRVVRVLCVDGHRVEDQVLSGVKLYFFAYMFLLFFLTLAISLDGYNLDTCFSAVVACVSSGGIAMDLAGPTGTFNIFSAPSKLLLCVGMLAGRLEIMPLLLMCSGAAWTQK